MSRETRMEGLPLHPYEKPALLNALDLAFVGDAVFGLLVREKLVSGGSAPVSKLHRESVRYVSAVAQAAAADLIAEMLNEEELQQYKRGRNAAVNTVPKNASVADYHKATGLEALFGYLYLSSRTDRIKELFDQIWRSIG